MRVRKNVVIKTSFPALHRFPEATGDTSYLKYLHRHVFHVVMKWCVTDNNREIEFLKKKTEVNYFIDQEFYNLDIGALSCESIAEILAKRFDANFVSVFEDDENGAEYYAEHTF